jgi:hypothetical protein
MICSSENVKSMASDVRPVSAPGSPADTCGVKHRLPRFVAAVAAVTLASACTAPARTDTAMLPATVTTAPPPVTTAAPAVPASTSDPDHGDLLPGDPAPALPDIIAWLHDDAPAAELAATVAAWAQIERAVLIAGEVAREELAARYPDLSDDVNASRLPSSLRIHLAAPSFLSEVGARLEALDGVENVVTATTPACNPFPGWNIIVFVTDDRQLTRLRNQLVAGDDITDITPVSRDAAYAEYLARFDGNPELTASITSRDMPVSLRARSANPVTLALLPGWFADDETVAGVQVYPPGAPVCH